MHRSVRLSLVLVAVVLAAATWSRAADNDSATGLWSWKTTSRNGRETENKIRLKQEGQKLTGALLGRNGRETEISDGKIKDGKLSFKIERQRNGRTVATTYTGELTGDTIKGTIETEGRNGQTRSRDWEAKRVKEKDKPSESSH